MALIREPVSSSIGSRVSLNKGAGVLLVGAGSSASSRGRAGLERRPALIPYLRDTGSL